MDDKLVYSTAWATDQVGFEYEASFSAPAGVTVVYNLPATYQTLGAPVVEGVFRIGTGAWEQFGRHYFLLNNASQVWIDNASGGTQNMTVRLYIYTDKVKY